MTQRFSAITEITIVKELKEEYFFALRERLEEKDVDLLEKLKIEKILAADQPPINSNIVIRVANHYNLIPRRRAGLRAYFTRDQAQLIKKTIRDAYILSI